MAERPAPPPAGTMGEPAGTGPDLILRLYAERAANRLPVLAVYGHAGFLRRRAERLGLDLDIAPVAPEAAGDTFSTALPVIDIEGLVPDKPGKAALVSAPLVINAIAE